ncbi:MAG: histidine kinase [Casimicrobiaceae bacterium]
MASLPTHPARPRLPRYESWYSGLTWKGMGLIAILCLINAARRTSRDLDFVTSLAGANSLVDWMMKTTEAAALGMLVAIPVMLSVVATYNLAPRKGPLRYVALGLAVAVSCAAGIALMTAVEARGSLTFVEHESLLNPAIVAYVRYGLLCALVAVVFVYLRGADESTARAHDAERDRARFVQRMEEARLNMLQAQIEPHFLFNVLANVRGLYADAPVEAERMLDNIIQYFAAALPRMRAADSTLGREAMLTTAYLEIQAIRMGRRLQFDLDIPPSLENARFPPLMLLTLAENAIKHGIAPLREGGTLRVSAAVIAGELNVRVADSGRGFTHTSGGGTGLANVRARLAAMHGEAASLRLAKNTPRGVAATIAVPLAT